MEKQHNRGQDGAGVANIKIDQKPGFRYISRYRSMKSEPVADLFRKISGKFKKPELTRVNIGMMNNGLKKR